MKADYRDIDLVAAWSPKNPETKEWIGVEFSFGNGFYNGWNIASSTR